MNKVKLKLFRTYDFGNVRGCLYQDDAIRFLKYQPSNSAALVFLDPPFNLKKTYSHNRHIDNRPEDEYQCWLNEILSESSRILKPGGALYLYHMPSAAVKLVQTLNELLTFRHWIAVSMKNGFVRGNRLYPAHYALLYYTKGAPSYFSRPKLLPKTCPQCGALQKDYGGYKKIIMEKGLNLSDIWDDFSPVRHRSTKTRDANELPLNLLKRVIEISGKPGDLFIDPFSGSGVGLLAAKSAGMNFIGCEIMANYCKQITCKLLA